MTQLLKWYNKKILIQVSFKRSQIDIFNNIFYKHLFYLYKKKVENNMFKLKLMNWCHFNKLTVLL